MPLPPPPKSKRQPRRPFPGLVGYWVKRKDFPGIKSFGVYACRASNCSKRWGSAHAHKEHGQGCQKCEHVSLPEFMWYNTAEDSERDQTPPSRDDEAAAHDRLRCMACAAGVCTVDVTDAFSGVAI
jgi:ferredoxin